MAWITEYQRWLSESESLNNAQMVANHFANSDWTKESLSAMCCNMRHESSINPDMSEYGYSWDSDRGYGLVQWTPRSKYWDWAVGRGLEPRNGDSQLARIDYEVDNNIQWIAKDSNFSGLTFKEFRTNARGLSVSQLTEAFTWGYERPNATAGAESMPSRVAFAERCFKELDWSGTGVGVGVKPFFPTTEGLTITSPYGWRTHPVTGLNDFHGAIDIGGGGVNHPIYATQNGIVENVVYSDSGGWMLYIRHTSDQYFSRYLHLASQPPVKIGQVVTRGQEIATMGDTGVGTGIHLDFAIGINNTGWGTEAGTIDPELYLQMTFGGGGGGVSEKTDKVGTLITFYLTNVFDWG